MRQTAERALAECVDESVVQPYFVGNAPAGHVALGEAETLFFHRCGRALRRRCHPGAALCIAGPLPARSGCLFGAG